jgi:hypothetical protein
VDRQFRHNLKKNKSIQKKTHIRDSDYSFFYVPNLSNTVINAACCAGGNVALRTVHRNAATTTNPTLILARAACTHRRRRSHLFTNFNLHTGGNLARIT